MNKISENGKFKKYNGKEFFDKINEIKAQIFNGITSEMESTINFYQSIPGAPTMSNGARIDPSNPISFKPSNAIAPDPTITKTNVKLNDTMIDFTAILDGIGKRTSLGLNLKVVGDSLLSKLDPNRTGIQVHNKQLAYFAIDAAGNILPTI
jgi:hypothetical protein